MKTRVEQLFHEVADLSTSERAKYFTEHAVDDDVRREVETLLAFDAGATEFLETDISAAAKRALPQFEPKHWRCGPYLLLHMIGRGGMGAVYLAERVDGEVSQSVAIKLLPLGAGDAYRQRFLQERQILSSLTHPNIARMMDAGHLDNGQPYLAMEYIDGRPIDVFALGSSVRQKTGLFLKVCSAVSYLHRNLVIHRDLKPSNILVTAEGEPKLLDFGIAKILDATTDATMTAMRMLTPDYASPEQVIGGRISTSTDIYSLGAVLYRLLTGKAAHEFEDHSAEAIAQMVTAREVTRPSRWSPELKGDVESVLLKALRKDPLERYATVEQFAEDLQAFLESRPVRARSGNAWYRTRKFVQRYWLPVSAAALVIASLGAGLYVADRQRVTAERRFAQLRQLSNRVLDLDKTISRLPGSTQARQSLVSASLEYLEGLAADARGDLDLAREVGEGYWRIARVQGVDVELNLGDPVKAEASLRKADALMERVLASRPKDRIALLRSAVIAHDRMILAEEEERNTEAVAFARKATERQDAYLLQGNVPDSDRQNAAGLYGNIAIAYTNMHMNTEALSAALRCVEVARSLPSSSYRLAGGLSLLADLLRYQGDLEGALRAIQEARKISEEAVYEDETARMIQMQGVLLLQGLIFGEDGGVNLGRPAEAIEPLQKAFDMVVEAARKDPHDAMSRGRAGTGTDLGNILRHRDSERALAVYDTAIRLLGEVPKSLSVDRGRARVLANSSYPLRRLHRAAEAKQRIDSALTILKETKDYPAQQIKLNSEIYVTSCALADYEDEEGDPRRAVQMYEQLLDKVKAAKPDLLTDLRDATRMSGLYGALTVLYRRTGQTAKAENVEARRIDLWRHWDQKIPRNSFVQRQLAARQIQ
jgi:tetratricopeptide (TPR) repeat protein/predicted Ser/Thr protein kinase